MDVLSLFSGIGAHDLGLQWAGMKIVGQCEKDTYCLNVLRRHWPSVPRWRDVKDVNRSSVIERCGGLPDLITGGFPCQQCSALNNVDRCGIGTEDEPTDRSGLVWQMLRIVEETKPRWVLFENVSRLRVAGADDILLSLERAGYACWPVVVGATHIGAPHRRMRVWIAGCRLDDVDIPIGFVGRAMAHAKVVELQGGTGGLRADPVASGEELAHSHGRPGHVQHAGKRVRGEPSASSQEMADANELPVQQGQASGPFAVGQAVAHSKRQPGRQGGAAVPSWDALLEPPSGRGGQELADSAGTRQEGYSELVRQQGGTASVAHGVRQDMADPEGHPARCPWPAMRSVPTEGVAGLARKQNEV